jgi:hypothetical protein
MNHNPCAHKVIASGFFSDNKLIKAVKSWVSDCENLAGYVFISDKSMVILHVELGKHANGNKLLSDLFASLVEAGCDLIKFLKTKHEGFDDFYIVSGTSSSYREKLSSIPHQMVELIKCSLREFPDDYKNAIQNCFNKLYHASLKIPEFPITSPIATLFRELIPVSYIPSTANSRISLSKESLGASFAANVWSQRYFRQEIKKIDGNLLDFELEDKNNGYLFADILGIRRPKLISSGCVIDEIQKQSSIVIKPFKAANLKGVYVIDGQGKIKDLEADAYIDDFDELKRIMRLLVANGKLRDSWIIEELIEGTEGGFVRDLKFYAFYGEVGLVQEETREPTRFCYYNENGEYVSTGRYKDKSFKGGGVPKEYFDLASRISLEIPSPLVRIDFMKSKEGPVLGEFTPSPGNFHMFNIEYDRKMGVCYSRARARLFLDLYHGKDFSSFKKYIDIISK